MGGCWEGQARWEKGKQTVSANLPLSYKNPLKDIAPVKEGQTDE